MESPMENILIIHSDPVSSERISNIVSQMGHSPSIASTLADGLLKARSTPFAIVFLEAQLPDGSGVDNIAKLKSSGASRKSSSSPASAIPMKRR